MRLDRKIGDYDWHMAYAFPFHSIMKNENYINVQKEQLHISSDTEEWN